MPEPRSSPARPSGMTSTVLARRGALAGAVLISACLLLSACGGGSSATSASSGGLAGRPGTVHGPAAAAGGAHRQPPSGRLRPRRTGRRSDRQARSGQPEHHLHSEPHSARAERDRGGAARHRHRRRGRRLHGRRASHVGNAGAAGPDGEPDPEDPRSRLSDRAGTAVFAGARQTSLHAAAGNRRHPAGGGREQPRHLTAGRHRRAARTAQARRIGLRPARRCSSRSARIPRR